MRDIIEERIFNRTSAPLVVAEMSGNHNQSLERALSIVDAAADAGAHALKIQTYTADTMTLDAKEEGFVVKDSESLWAGRSLYDLYQEAHTPWEWHKAIFDRCRDRGIIGFSSPFDETAVDFLETLDVPCYKIASFEVTDIQLIRKVAMTGKPMIISTGMATQAEIETAIQAIHDAGGNKFVLLKCTSTYPATPENTNVRTIPHMSEAFRCPVGLSDHTMGIGVAVASVALGAVVIEKHFTLSRAEGGVDSAFSLEPAELASLVIETQRAWQALGDVHYGTSGSESESLKYRRSLYIVKDLARGDVLTRDSLRAIRPGYGLPPKYLDILLGKHINQDVRRGTPMSWDLIG